MLFKKKKKDISDTNEIPHRDEPSEEIGDAQADTDHAETAQPDGTPVEETSADGTSTENDCDASAGDKPVETDRSESATSDETSTMDEPDADESENDEPDADTSDDGDESTPEVLNDFEASLKSFSVDDIAPVLQKRKSGFDYLRVLVLVVCVAVCLASTSTLFTNIRDKIRSEQIYGDIIDSVADGFNADGGVLTNGGKITLLATDVKTAYTPTMDEIIKNGIGEVTTPSDHSAELAKMRASLESLRNINEDIYAWIKIPGTNINYPVAQTVDNKYYLDHAYTGDNLVNGSIFADYRCNDRITKNYNTIFYGHNITSGSMFHDVEKFFDEKVFKDTLIYVYTFDGIYIFKPFSIHEVDYDSGFVNMSFSTGDDFAKFAAELQKESKVKSDRKFTGNDRIVTLSTCTNGIHSKRYALHGVLVEIISD